MVDNAPVPNEDSSNKRPWLSKTLIFNALMAALALVPGVNEWAKSHTEAVMMILTGANFVLRFITKDKISLKD